MAKKTAIICLEVLLDLLDFTDGLSPRKAEPDLRLLIGCWRIVVVYKRLVTRDDVLDPLEACEGTSLHYPSFAVPRSAGGVPSGRYAPIHPGDHTGSDSS